MTQTAASERRLSTALDRIDRALDAVAAAGRSPAPDDLARAEAARDAALGEATRLAAANDSLIAANRALTDASADDAADARVESLQAELAALQALRAAETAQMDEILAALEKLTTAEG